MNRNELADLVQSLTPAEYAQLSDIGDYLGEKAGPHNPSGFMSEGSVQALLSRQSPKLQQIVRGFQEVVSTPREMPFQPKLSEAENLDQLGFDGYSGQMVQDALDTGDVITGLHQRMGTDADTPDTSEPTTRELLSAAYEAHNHG